jgi:hypothetical protein
MMKRILPLIALVIALVPSCQEAPPSKPESERWTSRFPILRREENVSPPKNLRIVTHDDGTDTEIEDITSHVRVRVRLDSQASPSPSPIAIFQRLHARGVEDFLAFETRPAKEEARYFLDVSRAAGLRMIENSLEVLDAQGAPRLRVDPPYAIDSKGAKIDAILAIENCAYDNNPAAPWHRPVTPPGPNSAACALVVSWSSTNYPLLVDPSWVETASGTARDEQTSVKLANGKILITYGAFGSQGLSPGAELYDPTTKTLANTGSPGDRATRRPAILLPNNKALVLGASNPRVYDPALGTFSDTNPATSGHGGGTLTRLPSGKILVAGGGTVVELYDATTNSFSPGPAMKVARSFHAAARLNDGKVLLAGGGTDTAEIYDPAVGATGSFTRTVGNMTVARTDHEAVTLPSSGKVFIVGGQKAAELFDPATGMFTATGSMVDSRTRVRATLMPSGNVFVTGGFVLNTASALVERYEPALGVFTTAPVLNRARGFHIAELMDNGSMMVHGGRTAPTNFGAPLGDVEELTVFAAGTTCLHADDCASGICDLGGTCCLTTCNDTCKSCSPGTGACEVVRSADDLSSCTGANTCDANGACKKKNGQTCAAAGECASGSCTDGVCCNVACNGQCEACDGVQKGKCEPVVGAPRGNRSACASDNSTCGGACDGIKTATCNYPAAETACGASQCSNAIRIPNACNGEGTCKALAPRPCPGNFACLDDKTTCRSRCDSEKDCAVGYVCENSACTLTGKCDGDHRVISTDLKSVTDCTPYVCDETNRCRTTCENVGHCTAPFACNRYGQCVDPASAMASGSGCSYAGIRPSSNWTKSGIILLALLVLSRHVRRRARSSDVVGRGREPEIETRSPSVF